MFIGATQGVSREDALGTDHTGTSARDPRATGEVLPHNGRGIPIVCSAPRRQRGGDRMPSTGHKCTTSGIYRSSCNGRTEIALSNGETFPPCSHCRHAVTWTLVRATTHSR